jgi:ubiquitin C-terminal hydrolase
VHTLKLSNIVFFMKVDSCSIFDALASVSHELNYSHRLFHPEKIVIYRERRIDGSYGIRLKYSSELSVWQTIQRKINDQDFALSCVRKVVKVAVKTSKLESISEEAWKGIVWLNNEIRMFNIEADIHNRRLARSCFLRLVQKEKKLVKEISIPTLKHQSLGSYFAKIGVSYIPQPVPTPIPDPKNPALILPCKDVEKIQGIQNPGNHCYCNTSLKALWASQGFTDRLNAWIDCCQGHSEIARSLKNIFQQISTPVSNANGKCIQEESLRRLKENLAGMGERIKAFIAVFPQLKSLPDFDVAMQLSHHTQQDIREFFAVLLSATFMSDDPNQTHFPYVTILEQVSRERSFQYDKRKTGPYSEKIPAIHELFVSSLDASQASEELVISVPIPPKRNTFDIQEFFQGYPDTDILDVEVIVKQPENTSRLFVRSSRPIRRTEYSHQIESCRKLWGSGQHLQAKENPSIAISKSHAFVANSLQETPTFFVACIKRFIQGVTWDSQEKLETPVTTPYRISVPVVQESKKGVFQKIGVAEYVLKSVAVHNGMSQYGGHYVAYIPDPHSIGSDGMPKIWSRHSDSTVSTCCQDMAWEDICVNGYAFIYDRLLPVVTAKENEKVLSCQ